jgi:hypothetical protein
MDEVQARRPRWDSLPQPDPKQEQEHLRRHRLAVSRAPSVRQRYRPWMPWAGRGRRVARACGPRRAARLAVGRSTRQARGPRPARACALAPRTRRARRRAGTSVGTATSANGRSPRREPGARADRSSSWSRSRTRGRHHAGDRDMIDVSAAPPGHRVPQPPPLTLQGRKRAAHISFTAGAHAAARGEPAPTASVRGQAGRHEQQHSGDRVSADASLQQGEQAAGKCGRSGGSGAAHTPVLLLARIADHAHPMRYWVHPRSLRFRHAAPTGRRSAASRIPLRSTYSARVPKRGSARDTYVAGPSRRECSPSPASPPAKPALRVISACSPEGEAQVALRTMV